MGPSVPFIIGLILAHLHILYTIKQQKSLPPDTFSGGGEEKERDGREGEEKRKGWDGRGGQKGEEGAGKGRRGRNGTPTFWVKFTPLMHNYAVSENNEIYVHTKDKN